MKPHPEGELLAISLRRDLELQEHEILVRVLQRKEPVEEVDLHRVLPVILYRIDEVGRQLVNLSLLREFLAEVQRGHFLEILPGQLLLFLCFLGVFLVWYRGLLGPAGRVCARPGGLYRDLVLKPVGVDLINELEELFLIEFLGSDLSGVLRSHCLDERNVLHVGRVVVLAVPLIIRSLAAASHGVDRLLFLLLQFLLVVDLFVVVDRLVIATPRPAVVPDGGCDRQVGLLSHMC